MNFVERKNDYEVDCYIEVDGQEPGVLVGTIMQSEDADWGFIQHCNGDKTLVIYKNSLDQISDKIEEVENRVWD